MRSELRGVELMQMAALSKDGIRCWSPVTGRMP